MRRPLIIMSIFSLIAAGLTALFAPAASAASQCRFIPLIPRTLSIGQTVVGLTARISVRGPASCFANSDVSTHLVHGTNEFWLLWEKKKSDVESVYASEVNPGLYRTTGSDCDAYDSDYNDLDCSVAPASVVIKFTAHPRLLLSRSGTTLKVKTVATRYFEYDGYKPTRATVIIQRYKAGKWYSIHKAFAAGAAGYTWTYKNAPRGQYRAYSLETPQAFKAVSRPVAG